jgi:histidine triad (HIT) family protein
MPAGCTFCAIRDGRTPAAIVLDEQGALAFLDVRPLFPGHVLVVPRTHHATLLDLPEPEVGPFFSVVRRVAAAVTTSMAAQGTFVAANNVVSQSVPHLHLHVVPRTKGDGLRGFFWPRTRYATDAEMAEVAARIRSSIAS